MNMRMKYTRVKLLFMLLIALGLSNTPIALASNTQVFLSQVQVRNYSASDLFSHLHEAVVIKNDSEEDVDVTNWCVYYYSVSIDFSDGQKRKIGCFTPKNDSQKIFLKAGSVVRFGSFAEEFFDTSIFYTQSFSQGLGNDKGKLVLLNGEVEEDRVEWGVHPNALTLSGEAVFGRKQNEQGLLVYSGITKNDFEIINEIDITTVSEIYIKQDACPDIPNFQFNEEDCLEEEPPIIPEPNPNTNSNSEEASPGNNSSELTPTIKHTLQITEYFPNPIGSDAGNEFIELYNFGKESVFLEKYTLTVQGSSASTKKTYKLPNITLAPEEYVAIYNTGQQNFALNNTAGKISLIYEDKAIDESSYISTKEGYTWSLINDEFVLSLPSPNAKNTISDVIVVDKNGKITELKPCAADQERNPATGRCRKIPVVATPTPCKVGQERNPATGRCRNTASAQKPQVPCKVGQERNPTTGRCRNIKRTTPPKVGDSVKAINIAESSTIWIWLVAGVVLAAASAYIVWEWRYEIKKLFKNPESSTKSKKTKKGKKVNKTREHKNDL